MTAKYEMGLACRELVTTRQGGGGIETVSQMARGITSVASAVVAVDVATFEHMWERRESSCGHELSNLLGFFVSPRFA
jgi:hypothetical protein